MFDTMTMTKTVGAFCGSLLILLLGNWAAHTIYFGAEGGHDEGHAGQAYVIDTGAQSGAQTGAQTGSGDAHAAAAPTGPDFATLLASADPAKGEKVFSKCKSCHSLTEGENRVGPYLYGVVGRKVDSVAGFSYSGSLEKVAKTWTPENLNAFLENPKGFAPGTKMTFAGLPKAEDRANLIAFLDLTDGTRTPAAAAGAQEATAPAPAGGEAQHAAGTQGAGTQAAATQAAATQGAGTQAAGTGGDSVATGESTKTPAETAQAGGAAAGAPAAAAATETATTSATTSATTDGTAAGADAGGLAALVAAADPKAGEKVYRKCKSCHVADKKENRVGPYLLGVVGRAVASAEGFNYSDALKSLGGNWTLERLDHWLEKPSAFAPGNKMSFAGLSKPEDRAAVIAYMQSLGQ
ncbi:MAG: hypothetical protein Kow0058_14270 [Roseovarius sp.]